MFDPSHGYPSVVPYVRYRDPAAAIDWLTALLGVHPAVRLVLPDGRIAHAELRTGDHIVAIGLTATAHTTSPPPGRDDVCAMTLVFVPDVDAATARALELGATLVDDATDMPWGLRQSIVADPEGHLWELSTHQYDVPPADWGAELVGRWFDNRAAHGDSHSPDHD